MIVKSCIKALLLIGTAGTICSACALFAYGQYVHGPDLAPTDPSISLKGDYPPPDGWSEAAVADAFTLADELGASSVIVIADGRTVAEWGETNRKISAHSVRKSLVSALYGVAIERGLVDISMTMSELGIEESDPPLNEVERGARIEDLLTSRSGIYHPSVRDDNGPYPERGAHAPNEAFVYNNWSFNAVGGVFEQLTGLSLGQAFAEWIAGPIGMQDFVPEDVRYEHGEESVFPAYRFWMSGRDLMRFGLLYLNGGRWGDRQVVPEEWVVRSLSPISDRGDGVSYEYMWWIMPGGSYLATGTGGQKIRIYPDRQTVLVTRVDTGEGLSRGVWWKWGPRVTNSDTSELMRRLSAFVGE